MSPKSINPTSLAQYIRLDNCDRFLRFRMNPDDERYLLGKWNLTIQPLTPLLQEAGADFELNVGEHIAGRGENVIYMTDSSVDETIQRLKDIQKPAILFQPSVHGSLGAVKPTADLLDKEIRQYEELVQRHKKGKERPWLGLDTRNIRFWMNQDAYVGN